MSRSLKKGPFIDVKLEKSIIGKTKCERCKKRNVKIRV